MHARGVQKVASPGLDDRRPNPWWEREGGRHTDGGGGCVVGRTSVVSKVTTGLPMLLTKKGLVVRWVLKEKCVACRVVCKVLARSRRGVCGIVLQVIHHQFGIKKKRFFTKKSLKSYDDACYLTFLLQAFPKEKNPFGSDPSPVSRAKSK